MATATAAAGTATSPSGPGTQWDPWDNASNVTADDANYAECQFLYVPPEQWISTLLRATNFGFAIPAGASIDGITATVKKLVTPGTSTDDTIDHAIRLIKNGNPDGDSKALGTAWPTTKTTFSYGGATELWGLSLTPGDVNASDFGFIVQAQLSLPREYESTEMARVFYMEITVNYTAGAVAPWFYGQMVGRKGRR